MSLDVRAAFETPNAIGLGPLVVLSGSVPLPLLLASFSSFFAWGEGSNRIAFRRRTAVFPRGQRSLREPPSGGPAHLKKRLQHNPFERPASAVL